MSDEIERPVPTEPGKWVRRNGFGGRYVVHVEARNDGRLGYRTEDHTSVTLVPVADDGCWLFRLIEPADADALRERIATLERWCAEERDARVEEAALYREAAKREEALAAEADALRAERDRYREAVGRLRFVAGEYLRLIESGDAGDLDDRLVRDVLAATADEAIQGYPEPPEPDAALVAKANAALVAELEDRPTWADVVDTAEATSEAADRRLAALVAEVAELRADLAAERREGGEMPGWTYEGPFRGWEHESKQATVEYDDMSRDVAYVWRVGPCRDVGNGSERGFGREKYARAAMRSAEAEARRLGLIGSEP